MSEFPILSLDGGGSWALSFGEVRRLRLPNCGLDVSYATTRRDDPSAPIPANIDVPAPMTSDAYFAARDPAVEAITSSR